MNKKTSTVKASHRTIILNLILLFSLAILGCNGNGLNFNDRPTGTIGIGSLPPADADVLIDGTRKLLDEKWTYWEGPRFSSSLPIGLVPRLMAMTTSPQSSRPTSTGRLRTRPPST